MFSRLICPRCGGTMFNLWVTNGDLYAWCLSCSCPLSQADLQAVAPDEASLVLSPEEELSK